MKNIILIICCLYVLSCKFHTGQNEAVTITADTLVGNLEHYLGEKINIEGKIIHACPIDSKNENAV